MSHILLTRASFTDKDLLAQYLKISRRILVPALNAQTVKAFTWVIICKVEDRELLARELDYPFYPVTNRDEFREYSQAINATIETRHDIDDYMEPKYIERIQEAAEDLLDRYPQYARFLIQAQPLRWDLRNGQVRPIAAYTATRTSMHLSLVKRNGSEDPRTDILARIHSEMYKEVPRASGTVYKFPYTLTRWVIWGGNISLNRGRR